MKIYNHIIGNLASILFLLSISNSSYAQKKLEFEGGKDPLAVTTNMNGNIPGSRVIFESEFKLKFTTNMGDIPNENIGSGVINSLNTDTLYFFLPSNNNKRRISISADGYPDLVIPFTLGAKETYKYLIFDPKKMNSYDDNYTKGMNFMIKGFYSEAKLKFEQAKKCSDIPEDNDLDEKIETVVLCMAYSKGLDSLIRNQEWEKANNACLYLLKNSPDNKIYANNLEEIEKNMVSIRFQLWGLWGTYRGRIAKDKANGYGTFTFDKGSDLNYLEAHFVNNVPQGKGVCYWHNGQKYEGNYKNGLRDGKGTYSIEKSARLGIANCLKARKYVGEWKQNRKQGYGECYGGDGKLIYKGNFEKDKPTEAYPNK